MNPTLTVLIPTLGRTKELRDTVDDLLKQTRLPDQLIIIDQNTELDPELRAKLAPHPWALHIHSDRPGVVFNMNLGLKQATGNIILFIDDDVILSPQLIERHLLNYSDPEIVGVAGRVEQARGDLPPDQIKIIGHYNRVTGKVTANFNGLKRQQVDAAIGCNMSFRRTRLIDAGGFDLGFEGNSYYFEPDVCLRVLRNGGKLVFDPTAELKHLMAPMGGARIKDKSVHNYYFVKNSLRLYKRHSPTVLLPFFSIWMVIYSFLKAVKNGNPKIAVLGVLAVLKGVFQRI